MNYSYAIWRWYKSCIFKKICTCLRWERGVVVAWKRESDKSLKLNYVMGYCHTRLYGSNGNIYIPSDVTKLEDQRKILNRAYGAHFGLFCKSLVPGNFTYFLTESLHWHQYQWSILKNIGTFITRIHYEPRVRTTTANTIKPYAYLWDLMYCKNASE